MKQSREAERIIGNIRDSLDAKTALLHDPEFQRLPAVGRYMVDALRKEQDLLFWKLWKCGGRPAPWGRTYRTLSARTSRTPGNRVNRKCVIPLECDGVH